MKLAKAHEKKPSTLVGCAVRGSLSREGTKVAFLKDAKKEPVGTTEASRI